MSKTSSIRVSRGLVGKTCLVLWQENYTAEKPDMRSYALCERVHLGLGVVTGVEENKLTFSLYLHRMRDFGNGTFSAMNIRQGNVDEREVLPRRKPTRKLYGKGASNKYVVAVYTEDQTGETLRHAIEDVHWLTVEDKRGIISRLPEIHALSANNTKEAK